MTQPTLNDEQEVAVTAILKWVDDPNEAFMVLEGPAGTGKTFCVRTLPDRMKGRIIYTAPTNKATRELRKSVTRPDYKPECRTIYSLLGLKLEPNGEVKELSAPEDPVDLSDYRLVVVDEGSMISEKLRQWIKQAAESYGVKFLFMGDRYQLPPIGERRSPIWLIKNRIVLTKIMRYDNQILNFATAVRQAIDTAIPQIDIKADNDGTQGIWTFNDAVFRAQLMDRADEFAKPGMSKAIAWRNVTVDGMNKLIRSRLFRHDASEMWLPTDRVIYTGPARDLDDEPMASTDDEGTIERVEEDWHPVYGDVQCYRITIGMDDGAPTIARVIHPASQFAFARRLNDLAAEAKANRSAWGKYWDFKEAFHSIKHAYALTSHRAQGSTYEHAFVNWRDILLNRDRHEGFSSLYVSSTRPKTQLIMG